MIRREMTIKSSLIAPHFAWKRTSVRVAWRTKWHIAQELIATATLDRGEVVRDQPARPFDCDLVAVL